MITYRDIFTNLQGFGGFGLGEEGVRDDAGNRLGCDP